MPLREVGGVKKALGGQSCTAAQTGSVGWNTQSEQGLIWRAIQNFVRLMIQLEDAVTKPRDETMGDD